LFGDKRRPAATIAAEIDQVIGANMRRAREDVHLGQHELATLLGISVHVLIRYEEGQERAPAAVLLELTRHLGCHLTDLFAGMPSMEAEDEFPGSRPSGLPPITPTATPTATPGGAQAPAATVAEATGTVEAAVVASIIKAYSDLTSPTLRLSLVSVLQALG
jgi:transcriptional regulator with XRE-family HTH domain